MLARQQPLAERHTNVSEGITRLRAADSSPKFDDGGVQIIILPRVASRAFFVLLRQFILFIGDLGQLSDRSVAPTCQGTEPLAP